MAGREGYGRQGEPPLNDKELRIVRGMIDDHEYLHRRRQFWSGTIGWTTKALAILSAAAVVAESIKGLLGK